MAYGINIPYSDYSKLMKDSADKENIMSLLRAEFPDDATLIVAIKSILGFEDEEEAGEPNPDEPKEENEPSEEPIIPNPEESEDIDNG